MTKKTHDDLDLENEEDLELQSEEETDSDEIEPENNDSPTESQETNAEITYANATILIAINILPETEVGASERRVMISASNLGGAPVNKLVKFSDISPLPTAIAEIIDALKIELPIREAQRKLKQSQAKFKTKSGENQSKKSPDNPAPKKPNAAKQLSFFK